MTRVIKFRAWNTEQNKMWYDGGHMDLTVQLQGGLYTPDNYYGGDDQPDFILEQFTGLKDKNGVDIYEGDIVKVKGYVNYDIRLIYYSEYKCAFVYKISNKKDSCEWVITGSWKFEVIGNIHENPELLTR